MPGPRQVALEPQLAEPGVYYEDFEEYSSELTVWVVVPSDHDQVVPERIVSYGTSRYEHIAECLSYDHPEGSVMDYEVEDGDHVTTQRAIMVRGADGTVVALSDDAEELRQHFGIKLNKE